MANRLPAGLVRSQFTSSRSVPSEGFSWVDQLPEPKTLVEIASEDNEASRFLIAQGEDWENVQPLGVRDLHHEFAGLDSSDQILHFANQWGFLGDGRAGYPTGQSPHYETLDRWNAEIWMMRFFLDLWGILKIAENRPTTETGQLKRRRAVDELAKHIEWIDSDNVRVCSHDDQESCDLYGNLVIPPGFRNMVRQPYAASDIVLNAGGAEQDDVVGATRCYVESYLTYRLWGHNYIMPMVIPSMSVPCHLQLLVSSYRSGGLLLRADCLNAALYCLFALEVSGKTPPPKDCVICGEVLNASRRNRQYCSPACCQKAYRMRKNERKGVDHLARRVL